MKKQMMFPEDACMLVHSALRKVCYSPATSAAYNVIHLINVKPRALDPWVLFGLCVADAINKSEGEIDGDDLKSIAAELNDTWFEVREKREKKGLPADSGNGVTSLYALTGIFRLFSEKDWESIAEFITFDDDDKV